MSFSIRKDFYVSLKAFFKVIAFTFHFRYKEVCDPGYNFKSGSFSGKTGHFTQVVWKESTELGLGRASNTKKNGMVCTYVVGRYRSAGNYRGEFQENVLKGNFSKSICDKLDDMIAKVDTGIDSYVLYTPFPDRIFKHNVSIVFDSFPPPTLKQSWIIP